jgi:hypothetical protein
VRRIFGGDRRLDEPGPLPRAPRAGELPANGRAAVAGVDLGEGRSEGTMWRAHSPNDAIGAWVELAAAFPDTGLWPVLLERGDHDVGVFEHPEWPAEAERDAEAVLRELWDEVVVDAELEAMHGPFGGLGHGRDEVRPAVALVTHAMEGVGGLGLVAVTRPADVPGALGWSGAINHTNDTGLLCAVLRSWEERYDAILVGLGFDTMYLGVRRRPEGAQARTAAREMYAFCPDIVDQGVETIEALAQQIETSPVWPFWWD